MDVLISTWKENKYTGSVQKIEILFKILIKIFEQNYKESVQISEIRDKKNDFSSV